MFPNNDPYIRPEDDPNYYGLDPKNYPGSPQATGDVKVVGAPPAKSNGTLRKIGKIAAAGIGAGLARPSKGNSSYNLGRSLGAAGKAIYDKQRKAQQQSAPPPGVGASAQSQPFVRPNTIPMGPLGYQQYIGDGGPQGQSTPVIPPTVAPPAGPVPLPRSPQTPPSTPPRTPPNSNSGWEPPPSPTILGEYPPWQEQPAPGPAPINPTITWNPPGRVPQQPVGTARSGIRYPGVNSTVDYGGGSEDVPPPPPPPESHPAEPPMPPAPPYTGASGGGGSTGEGGTDVNSGIKYPGLPGYEDYNYGSGSDDTGDDNGDEGDSGYDYTYTGTYPGGGGGSTGGGDLRGGTDDTGNWDDDYDPEKTYLMAEGGRVTEPVVAEIGEDGEEEDVVPKSKAVDYAKATLATGTPPDPSTIPSDDAGPMARPPAMGAPGSTQTPPSIPTAPAESDAALNRSGGPPPALGTPGGPPPPMGEPGIVRATSQPGGAIAARAAAINARPPAPAVPGQAGPPQLPTLPPVKQPKIWQRIAAGALGAAAGISNARGGARPIDVSGAADQILYPGRQKELAAYKTQAERVKEQAALNTQYENTAGLKDQREATAEQRRQQAAQYDQAAQDRQAKIAADAKAKADALTQKRYEGYIKGREDSVIPLHKGETAPPGWQVIDHPDGYQVAIPPAQQAVPKALLPYLPGRNEGDMVANKEYRDALAKYQDTLSKKEIAGEKPMTVPDAQQVLDVAARTVAQKRGLTLDPAKPLMGQLPVDAQGEAVTERKRLETLPPSDLDKALKTALLAQRTQQTNTTPTPINPGTREFRIAQDLAYGKLTMQQFRSLSAYSRDTNKKMDIYDKAGELNPNFNPAAFEMGYSMAKNPRVQQQLSSLDNVVQGMPDMIRLSDAADRSGITILNKLIVPGGVAIGGKTYSNLVKARTAFADELSGALGYGSATDMSREMGLSLTDPDLSPENFRSALQEVVEPFIQRKRKSMLDQMGIYGQPGMNPAADKQNPQGAPATGGGRGVPQGPKYSPNNPFAK